MLWSGEFTTRKKAGFVRHSGIVAADFDNVANPAALRNQIATDPHCLAAWISSSATGVWALFAVDPARPHAESWRAVNIRCKDAFGVDIDQACTDVARLCFMSWDPNAYVASGDVAPVPYPSAPVP